MHRLNSPLVGLLMALLTLAVPGSAAADVNAGGGSALVITPQLKQVTCLRSCARKRAIRGGSLVRITGTDLEVAKQVIFLGTRGSEDDATANVIAAGTAKLKVRVPPDAVSGSLVAVAADGTRSKPTAPLAIRPKPPVIGTPDLQPVPGTPAGVTLETGTSTPRVVFFGAKQLVRFSLRVGGIDNATAAVALIRESTGETVATWSLAAPAGQIVSVDWNGTIQGAAAPAGRYRFTATVSSGAGLLAQSATATGASTSAADPRDQFDLYGFMFPVRGKHNFGQDGARFGAGRVGHIHQGQDVLANCGLRLVAARGGTVVQSRFQAAAGNFIVIRPDAGGGAPIGDQAYMHLAVKSPFNPGDRVYTGQTIGNVGRTGDATACHLHFEEWTGAIWSSAPFDPLPDLLAWDQIS